MNLTSNKIILSKILSFDGTEVNSGFLAKPDKYRSLLELLSKENKVIARGSGLSYCAASFGDGITSISTAFFNRIVSFDKVNGIIRIEPGIKVGVLLDIVSVNNWILPVIPGHPEITVGGCVAFNVHGKSQAQEGNFGEWVNKLLIFHPNLGEIECSPSTNSELFDLTVGGFGLTGFILEIELRLKRLTGNSIKIKKSPAINLFDSVDQMKEHLNDSHFIYSWNNLNYTGNKFGKGIVYIESFCEEKIASRVKYKSLFANRRSIMKYSLLNKFTIPLVLNLFLMKENISSKTKVVNLQKACFPMNSNQIYFKLFGKKGFREYQLLIPSEYWNKFVPELERLIRMQHIIISLGSLKLFKGENKLLNFNGEGICLAIDVPENLKAIRFFNQLDKLTIKYNGIANLSKDSRLNLETVKQMYPEYNKFVCGIKNIDCQLHFDSLLRRRLGIY